MALDCCWLTVAAKLITSLVRTFLGSSVREDSEKQRYYCGGTVDEASVRVLTAEYAGLSKLISFLFASRIIQPFPSSLELLLLWNCKLEVLYALPRSWVFHAESHSPPFCLISSHSFLVAISEGSDKNFFAVLYVYYRPTIARDYTGLWIPSDFFRMGGTRQFTIKKRCWIV